MFKAQRSEVPSAAERSRRGCPSNGGRSRVSKAELSARAKAQSRSAPLNGAPVAKK